MRYLPIDNKFEFRQKLFIAQSVDFFRNMRPIHFFFILLSGKSDSFCI